MGLKPRVGTQYFQWFCSEMGESTKKFKNTRIVFETDFIRTRRWPFVAEGAQTKQLGNGVMHLCAEHCVLHL